MKFFVIFLVSVVSAFAQAKAPLFAFGSNSAHATSLPFNFKIVDWNVEKGDRDGMAKDFGALSENADVALLQESYETPELVSGLAAANEEFAWNMVQGFVYEGHYTGVATGSRVSASKIEGFLTNVHEPILNSPKTMLLSVYPLENSNQSLSVLNVHGINFVLNSKYRKQVDQIVSILKDCKGPVLVAGDFNTWNSGRMEYLDKQLATLGLKRLALDNEKSSKLDHAYVRGLEAKEAKLFPEINSSDHKPMVLELQIENSPAQLADQ